MDYRPSPAAGSRSSRHPVDDLGHGHRSSPNGAEAISPHQVEAQGAQQRQNLNAVAFGIAVGGTDWRSICQFSVR
jgi:hypothetical protein